MTTQITTKTFAGKLSAYAKSTITQRDNLQDLIKFGLDHYKIDGDATYLTRVIQQCIELKAVPAVTVKDYIKAHANVVYGELKDKTIGFKKVSKKAPIETKYCKVTWYEWSGGKHNTVKKDFDAVARAKALITSIANAEKCKDKNKAVAIVAALEAVLAA